MNKQLADIFKKVLRYRMLIFAAVLIGLYGFLAWRVHALTTAEPAQSTVDSKTASFKTAHIDQSIVDKVTELHDNSVNVRALFNQARKNPFHE